jgi:hypothetical protein
MSLSDLLLEAGARFPQLGRTPGSHAFEVIQRDSRMRLMGSDGDCLSEVNIIPADLVTRRELRQGAEEDPMGHWLRR